LRSVAEQTGRLTPATLPFAQRSCANH